MMSASTTAVSFLCLAFVKSEALKDLGIFAAVTVMLSAVLSLVIIPLIYQPQRAGGQPAHTFLDKIGAYPYERNKSLVYVSFAVIVVSFFGFNKIKFNNNIGDLNYVPQEMRKNEQKLGKISDLASKSVYAVSYGHTENEALQHNAALTAELEKQKKASKILSFSSIGDIALPQNLQQERIRNWDQFWTPARKTEVLHLLKQNGSRLGFSSSAFSEFEAALNKNYRPLTLKDYKRVPAFQISDLMASKNGLYTATSIVKVEEHYRDEFLRSMAGQQNVVAVDRQQMNENFLGLLKNDFNSLINYSLVAVIIIFLVFFRSIDLTVFAVIPIILSGVVTAGILYFLGLELNIFSTIVCTLVFGAGVDFNIFLTQAMQKELQRAKANSLLTVCR